jgi:molecular chaperone GrpE
MTTENTEIDKEMDDVTLDNNASEEQVVADELSVEELTQDLAKEKDKYLRLFAEFENYKRRTSKERIDYIRQQIKKFCWLCCLF